MKKLLALLLSCSLIFCLFGCDPIDPSSSRESSSAPAVSSSPEESSSAESLSPSSASPTGEARIAALKGPTAMGLIKLMEDSASSGSPFQFSISASADEITPKLVQGELDLAAVPANLASVLYNQTGGAIQVLMVNTLGVLYLVENGDTIHSPEDLRGKTIFASGKGATPEYALNYMLSENGIDPEKDVTIEWKSEHTECAAALASTENAIAMLPQPFVTTAQMKNEGLRVALDLTAEWEKLSSKKDSPAILITGVMVGRREFLEENRELVSEFLKEYRASVSFVQENTEEAAELIGKYDIVPAPVAKQALPHCSITYLDGGEMEERLSGYLSVLFEQNPKAVGGALPAGDFYYLP